MVEEFGLWDIDKANLAHVRSWIIFLSKRGDSNRTVNRRISALRAFYRYLSRIGVIDEFPISKVKMLKVSKKLEPVYSQKEMILLSSWSGSCGEHFSQFRDRFMVDFFYTTGVRLSELINLKVSDIDFVKKEMRILGKGNRQRIIPFFDNNFRALQDYFLRRQQVCSDDVQELFITDKGRKMYPRYVYGRVNRLLSEVTAKRKKSPHMLRHTFATHMINKGADLKSVKDLLGHSGIASTHVYINSDIDGIKNKYNNAHPRADR